MDVACVGAVVRDADGRLLVVRRGRPPSQGLWSLPGGRIEPGEAAADAVRREVREETGLTVDVAGAVGDVVLPGARPGDRYLVTDYVATVSPGTPLDPAPGDDADATRWVTHDEFLDLDLVPGLASTLQRWAVWGGGSR